MALKKIKLKLLKMLMSGSNRMATCRSAHRLLANSIDNPSRHFLQVIFSPSVIDTPSKHVLGKNPPYQKWNILNFSVTAGYKIIFKNQTFCMT